MKELGIINEVMRTLSLHRRCNGEQDRLDRFIVKGHWVLTATASGDQWFGNHDLKSRKAGGHIVPLSLENKKAIVAEVGEMAAHAHSAVAAEYRGLSVEEMTALRAKARNEGVHLRVVKNTLARRALRGTDFECMQPSLIGPMILAFSQDEPGAAARLVKEFSKEHEKLKVQVLSIGGQLLEGSELNRVANLPTREQALSMLMAVIKAPMEKLVRTLVEPHAKLVRTMAAVRDTKQSTV
jgi:large subunit ribosomal protein L10